MLTAPQMRLEPTCLPFPARLSWGWAQPLKSSTCVTHRKWASVLIRQQSLSTNARLTSCLFPLPFIDHLESSCGCKPRPHSLYTHPQPQKTVANLTQDSCQVYTMERLHSTKWGGTTSWGEGVSWLDCKMGRSMKRANKVWFAPRYCHSLQLRWPLQEEHTIHLAKTQALYTTATEDYFRHNTDSR